MSFFYLQYKWKTLIKKFEDFILSTKIKARYQKKKGESVKTLRREDKGKIFNNPKEIRLFAIMRNESLRLHYFLSYYKNLKVDRFFIIDNNSNDNSIEIALKEENTHVFSTNETYVNHWYWMEHLLDTYGKNHWCLVVDIDELFSYPNQNILKLPQLVGYFEEKKYTSISSLLLDMYDSEELSKINYIQNESPLSVLRFFDKDYYKSNFHFWDWKNMKSVNINAYTGGMRERVFGSMQPLDILTKISFFKYEKEVYLIQGMHAISNTTPSDIEGIVFHTKFLQDFISEVQEEAVREEHYGNAIRYKHYNNKIHNNLSLYCKEKSVKYESLEQLIELGLMKTSSQFEIFASKYLNQSNK